jgi:hypothetical protein
MLLNKIIFIHDVCKPDFWSQRSAATNNQSMTKLYEEGPQYMTWRLHIERTVTKALHMYIGPRPYSKVGA